MSSAIEVLKLILFEKQNEAQEAESDHLYYIALEHQEAIKTALLALERLPAFEKNFEHHVKCDAEIKKLKEDKAELKMWLEKEIVVAEKDLSFWDKECKKNSAVCFWGNYHYNRAKVDVLREVFGMVKDEVV